MQLLWGKCMQPQLGSKRPSSIFGRRWGLVDIPNYAWISSALWETIHTLNVAPVAGIEDELKQLTSVMENPGPFLAYTHGDPCPDNILTGTSGKLFDFEFGAYRHALIEGVYAHMPFPTCWCVSRLPAHVVHRMETSYRMELARECPAAHNDRLFAQAVAAAALSTGQSMIVAFCIVIWRKIGSGRQVWQRLGSVSYCASMWQEKLLRPANICKRLARHLS